MLSGDTEVERAILERRSIRQFRDVPVSRDLLTHIITIAGHAPSNSNTQPWHLDLLLGESKEKLSAAVVRSFRENPEMPSAHFPDPLPQENRERQMQFGALFYGAYHIERGDTDAVERQLLSNYSFYGAPVGAILSIDSSLKQHSWLDCGIFLQSFMLSAKSHGIGTCAQVVFAAHEAAIKKHLELPQNRSVICGISIGYPEPDAAINNVTYPRAPLNAFCTVHG